MRLKLSTLNAPISTDETNSTDGTDTGASNNPTLAAPCVDLGLIDVLGPKLPVGLVARHPRKRSFEY